MRFLIVEDEFVALDDVHTVLRAFRDDADGFLVKPFDPGKLHALLEQFGYLSSSSLRGPGMAALAQLALAPAITDAERLEALRTASFA
jgi:PleD family two-component response regulator